LELPLDLDFVALPPVEVEVDSVEVLGVEPEVGLAVVFF
jgi:hypothetical protein